MSPPGDISGPHPSARPRKGELRTMTSSIPSRTLGPENLIVGAIGYGAMSFANPYGQADYNEDKAADEILGRALDLGVTLIDTADGYGPSEEILGRALKGRRDTSSWRPSSASSPRPTGAARRWSTGRPHICGSRSSARSPGWIPTTSTSTTNIASIRGSRSRTPSVRWRSWSRRARFATSRPSEAALDTLRRAVAVHPITALETEWSLWARQIEAEILPVARDLGIAIAPYSPLGRGALTSTITKLSDLPEKDLRHSMPWYSEENFAENMRSVEIVRGIAAELEAAARSPWRGSSPRDPMSCPSPAPGAFRPRAECRAATLTLIPEHLAALDAIRVAGDRDGSSATEAHNWFAGHSA